MGSNRRYAEQIDVRVDARTDAMVMRDHSPQSLADRELELDEQPLTRPPRAIRVKAWVHFDSIALKVDAEAVAWTPRAVAIRWTAPHGEVQKAWVWASAVEGIS